MAATAPSAIEAFLLPCRPLAACDQCASAGVHLRCIPERPPRGGAGHPGGGGRGSPQFYAPALHLASSGLSAGPWRLCSWRLLEGGPAGLTHPDLFGCMAAAAGLRCLGRRAFAPHRTAFQSLAVHLVSLAAPSTRRKGGPVDVSLKVAPWTLRAMCATLAQGPAYRALRRSQRHPTFPFRSCILPGLSQAPSAARTAPEREP